jgi:hypothetical protein
VSIQEAGWRANAGVPEVWPSVEWQDWQSERGACAGTAGCTEGQTAVSWQEVQSRVPGIQVALRGAPPIGEWHATVQVAGDAGVIVPPAVLVPRG